MEEAVNEGFTPPRHYPFVSERAASCPHGKPRGRNETNGHLPAFAGFAHSLSTQRLSTQPCWPVRSVGRSYPRRPGVRIQFAPIAWRALWQLRLELLAAGHGGLAKPQNRATSNIPRATSFLPRAGLQLRPQLLLCLRATGLQARLAQGSMERRTEQERGMASRLRRCVAILERAER
jgi:hypothetical protein